MGDYFSSDGNFQESATRIKDCLYCNGSGIESKQTFDNSDVCDSDCDLCNGNGYIITSSEQRAEDEAEKKYEFENEK